MVQVALTESSQLDERGAPINLRECPTPHNYNITQFTLGDLHANMVTFIHALIQNRVCRQLSPVVYQKLIDIYEAPLSRDQFRAFNQFIDTELSVLDKNTLVRLIGDLLADRGRCDWFILKILKKLKDNGVNIRILMSNHDLEFLKGIGLKGNLPLPAQNPDPNIRKEIKELHELLKEDDLPDDVYADAHSRLKEITTFYDRFYQGRSFIELEMLIHAGILTRAEVIDIVENVYLPSLLMLDYSLHDDKITIFTHAHVDIEEIASLCFEFGVAPALDTPKQIQATIDAINEKFRAIIVSGDFSYFELGTVANRFLWLREEELHKEHEPDPRLADSNMIIFVCGHDSNLKLMVKNNVVNLDNLIGKKKLNNPKGETALSYLSNEKVQFLKNERKVRARKVKATNCASTAEMLNIFEQNNTSVQTTEGEMTMGYSETQAAELLLALSQPEKKTTTKRAWFSDTRDDSHIGSSQVSVRSDNISTQPGPEGNSTQKRQKQTHDGTDYLKSSCN